MSKERNMREFNVQIIPQIYVKHLRFGSYNYVQHKCVECTRGIKILEKSISPINRMLEKNLQPVKYLTFTKHCLEHLIILFVKLTELFHMCFTTIRNHSHVILPTIHIFSRFQLSGLQKGTSPITNPTAPPTHIFSSF